MKAYRGSGGIAPLELNFGTRWRGVETFTPGLGGPQDWFGCFGED